MNVCIADYHKKDCLVHSDSHVFNILAESKPSIDHFWPRWYSCIISFPIGCLICFGLNGQIEANESIEVYITSSLDEYLELMSEAGKSANEQRCLWGGGAKYHGDMIHFLNVK